MAVPADIVLKLAVGEVDTGIWCDRCLLPSAMTAHVYVQRADTGHRVGEVGTVTRCPDCEGWLVPDDEEDCPA